MAIGRRLIILSFGLVVSLAQKPSLTAKQKDAQQKSEKLERDQNQADKQQSNAQQSIQTTVPLLSPAPAIPEQKKSYTDPPKPFDFWEWTRTSSPTDILSVLVTGILAIAAFCTLKEVRRQSRIAAKAAIAAKITANATKRSLVLLNRPWLDVEGWAAEHNVKGANETMIFIIWISFRVKNPSNTPVLIEQIHIEVGDSTNSIDHDVRAEITPKNWYEYRHPGYTLNSKQALEYMEFGTTISITGSVTYKDFVKRRVKAFRCDAIVRGLGKGDDFISRTRTHLDTDEWD